MGSFLRSLKTIKYLGSFSRCTILCNVTRNPNFIYDSQNGTFLFPRRSRSTEVTTLFKENGMKNKSEKVDEIIQEMDNSLKRLGRVPKTYVTDFIKYIERVGYVDSSQASLVLRCCGNIMMESTSSERIEVVKDLWNTLNFYNIPMDTLHYNALLQVHLDNDFNFNPMEFLSEMRSKNIPPNKITYQRLLEFYCKDGNISAASKILEYLKEEGHGVSENIFNLLIIGYSRIGDIENAVNMLTVMKQANIHPSIETYTAVMCAYAKINDIQSIQKILHSCEASNIHFLNSNIFDVLHTLIVNNHTQHISELLSKIKYVNDFPVVENRFLAKLVDIKQEDTAKDILLYLLSLKPLKLVAHKLTNFFVTKLIYGDVASEKIVQLCAHIETHHVVDNAFKYAIKDSLYKGRNSLSLLLLKTWKERGEVLRQHYFWPIFVKYGKENNFQGILDTLSCMTNDCEVIPCISTVKDYIIPYAFNSPQELTHLLRQYKVPKFVINNAIVCYLLKLNKTRHAMEYMVKHSDIYSNEVLKDVLNRSLFDTNDTDSFICIAQQLYEIQDSYNEKKKDLLNKKISINKKIVEIMQSRNVPKILVNNLINSLYKQRVRISWSTYTILHDKCDNESRIVLEELKFLSVSKHRENVNKDLMAILKQMSNVDKKNRTVSYDRIIRHCFAMKDIDSVVYAAKVLYKIDQENPNLPRVHSRIADLYFQKDQITEGKKYIHMILQQSENQIFNLSTILRYSTQLLTKGYLDDAKELIKEYPNADKNYTFYPSVSLLCNYLLKVLGGKYNVDEVSEFYDLLSENKYLVPSKINTQHLINAHVIQNDLESTLKVLNNIYTKFNLIPNDSILLRTIIQKDDTNLLQTYIDLLLKKYSNKIVLIQLLVNFVENDRMKQAKKVMQTLKEVESFVSIPKIWESYVTQNKKEYLEKFFDLSNQVLLFDRTQLSYYLLKVYAKKNDWQSALQLWSRMQEENILPNEEFILSFTNLLKCNDKNLPLIHTDTFNQNKTSVL